MRAPVKVKKIWKSPVDLEWHEEIYPVIGYREDTKEALVQLEARVAWYSECVEEYLMRQFIWEKDLTLEKL